MVLVSTMRTRRAANFKLKFDKPAERTMFQVTQIARFLLERGGLRFRNLGFCGHWHDLM